MKSKHYEGYEKNGKVEIHAERNDFRQDDKVEPVILFGLGFDRDESLVEVMFRVRVPFYMLSPVPATC